MNPKRKRSECMGYEPNPEFVAGPAEEIEQTIPDRFLAQVGRYADRPAVISRDLTLTYVELNRAANRLAHMILRRVGSDQQRVGVLLEQGSELIVAILAVLKSGNVYVPLDPTLPMERLRAIVDGSGSQLIVTNLRSANLTGRLPDSISQCLRVEEANSTVPHFDPNVTLWPDSLATILYTSGSTGEPKGVMHSHKTWLLDLQTRAEVVCASTNERIASVLYPGFVGGFTDLTDALLNGATLLLHDVRERGTSGLASWLTDECITVYHSVPTVYRHFIAGLAATEKLPTVRQIQLGGEPIVSQDIELFAKHFSKDCTLCIRTGATESPNVLTCFIDQTTPHETASLLLGYALESRRVGLVGMDGGQPGPGEIGDMTIESACMSYGYWQNPDDTARVFQPSTSSAGGRVYHTRDLAWQSPDGLFHCAGRRDSQIKIRAQRVELGEIEGALLGQSGVREAVVNAQPDRAGRPMLVAYVVFEDGDRPSNAFLRARLAETLPRYMVPQIFVPLDRLPRTSTGKVDRKALPGPEAERLETAFVDPRTKTEQLLAEIWKKVLGLERIGVHDDFFELGGHSLLATRVIARVQEGLDVNLPIRALFESPTIAGLAECVETLRWAAKSSAGRGPRGAIDDREGR